MNVDKNKTYAIEIPRINYDDLISENAERNTRKYDSGNQQSGSFKGYTLRSASNLSIKLW